MALRFGQPIRRRPVPAAHALAALAGQVGCPVLARLYATRGVSPAQLDYRPQHLLTPDGLHGIDTAVHTVSEVLRDAGRLLVVADYDADGATGCALAVRGLRALGASHVDYLVPSRFSTGYGLSVAVAEAALERRPDLVLTVDNGITSLDGIACLRTAGVPVVVTDHHLPGDRLPPATAIINPRLPGDGFASKHLAGVGVMFYLLLALRRRLREHGWFGAGRAEPNLGQLLDLVALGTVADVVPLDYNNRLLVAQGLARLNAGGGQPGLRALLDLPPGRAAVTATELGFRAGPRLNAAGRMDDMSLGIECLLCDDPATAADMAAALDALNRERRAVQAQMQEQAEADLADLPQPLPAALSLHAADWHPGVLGIVAARVRERCGRPVVALAPAGDGRWRGSARSVSGVHIRDALAQVAAWQPQLLDAFGGHAMAAGLTLAGEQHLPAFAAALADAVLAQTGGVAPDDALDSDGPLGIAELTLELAQRLQQAGPWGQGFPAPLFDDVFTVHETRVVGADHLRLRLSLPGGPPLNAIAWGAAPLRGQLATSVRVAYEPQVNSWRGMRELQLLVRGLSPA